MCEFEGALRSYLLFGYVDGFVEDNPDGGLPASRMGGGSLVGHEVVCVGQQFPQ